jgi:hypothetical protein
MLTQQEADALIKVLSLAENHPMWSNPMSQSESLKDFVDDQYKAITEVREFLKRNGVMTLHELTQQLAKKALSSRREA